MYGSDEAFSYIVGPAPHTLEVYLNEFSVPGVPVLENVSVELCEEGHQGIAAHTFLATTGLPCAECNATRCELCVKDMNNIKSSKPKQLRANTSWVVCFKCLACNVVSESQESTDEMRQAIRDAGLNINSHQSLVELQEISCFRGASTSTCECSNFCQCSCVD
jgi:hypothetical protein